VAPTPGSPSWLTVKGSQQEKPYNIKFSKNAVLPFCKHCEGKVKRKPLSLWVESNRLESSSWFTLTFAD